MRSSVRSERVVIRVVGSTTIMILNVIDATRFPRRRNRTHHRSLFLVVAVVTIVVVVAGSVEAMRCGWNSMRS